MPMKGAFFMFKLFSTLKLFLATLAVVLTAGVFSTASAKDYKIAVRPARLGQPGHRRPGGRRRNGGGPHLPPRPGLRLHGSQAARHRRRY